MLDIQIILKTDYRNTTLPEEQNLQGGENGK